MLNTKYITFQSMKSNASTSTLAVSLVLIVPTSINNSLLNPASLLVFFSMVNISDTMQEF